ncbi:uncharacterized protein RMCFA_5562 [Mycolicibacterium fortuitum subsp. acetamidolyticum]|uniref:Uncharacterized protein n=1 Tax=Mycolicibacterium fortuitum subsp. acetamidolyticum TaxID=144550 RepID=A0A117IG86_MYCFO|nr:uncharacterized protein RMCFA_5562 [Mycolicibacterium fortuitum subsp. acetamidolyticum]
MRAGDGGAVFAAPAAAAVNRCGSIHGGATGSNPRRGGGIGKHAGGQDTGCWLPGEVAWWARNEHRVREMVVTRGGLGVGWEQPGSGPPPLIFGSAETWWQLAGRDRPSGPVGLIDCEMIVEP